MIRLIINEKKNNIGYHLMINLLFSIIFLAFFAMLHIILNVNDLYNSDWYNDFSNGTTDMLRQNFSSTYVSMAAFSFVALIVTVIIYIIILKTFINNNASSYRLMHTLGFNINQIFIYGLYSFIVDLVFICIICIIPILIIPNYVNKLSGITKLFGIAGISSGSHFYVIFILLFFIIFFYMIFLFRLIHKICKSMKV